MAQHDALGTTRSPGCIQYRRKLLDLGHDLAHRCLTAQLLQETRQAACVVFRCNSDDLDTGRLNQLRDGVPLRVRPVTDQQAGLAMLHLALEYLSVLVRIEWHGDAPRRECSIVNRNVMRRIPKQKPNTLTRHPTSLTQACRGRG